MPATRRAESERNVFTSSLPQALRVRNNVLDESAIGELLGFLKPLPLPHKKEGESDYGASWTDNIKNIHFADFLEPAWNPS